MTKIKGVFRSVFKFRVTSVLFIVIIVGIAFVITCTILDIYVPESIWDNYVNLISILTALSSGVIALLLPFIIKSVEENKTLEKRKSIRKKCYNAIDEICNFCIKCIEPNTNLPKANIQGIDRLGVISQVEILTIHRKEALEMDIILSSGWKESKGTNINIYVFIGKELQVLLKQHEYGTVMYIELKYNNKFVLKKEEITPVLEMLKNKIREI